MYLSKIQIFIKKYYKSLLWAIIILYLSLANINENETIKVLLFPFSDKIAHLTVYAILSFLILYDRSKKKKLLFPFIVSVFYGILMELLQYSLTTYRSFEVADMIANTIGAIIGLLFYKKFYL